MADIEMIDDAYWLKYAKDHVTNAIKARDEAANKIDVYLGVVWAIYIAVFTTAIVFSEITDNVMATVVMALPVIVIPLARFLSLKVLLPPLVKFNFSIPLDIKRNGYSRIILRKSSALVYAQIGAFVSALSIGVAIFTFKVSEGRKMIYYVEAVYNSHTKSVQVEGRGPTNKDISISIAGTTDTTNKNWSYAELKTVKSDVNGFFHIVLPSSAITGNIKAFANWSENNTSHTIKSQ